MKKSLYIDNELVGFFQEFLRLRNLKARSPARLFSIVLIGIVLEENTDGLVVDDVQNSLRQDLGN